MKILAILITGLMLASCSGHIVPPSVKLGKKCTQAEDGQIVYSYIWLHKKGEEVTANAKTCELIK